MKKLTYVLTSLLIGLSIYSCHLFEGEDLTTEYYNAIIKNDSKKELKLIFTNGIKEGIDTKITSIRLSSNKGEIYTTFDLDSSIADNIRLRIDDSAGSKIECYIDNELVKTWVGPHGNYEVENTPYNYSSWKKNDFEKPIITSGKDRILGEYIFTITDEDLK